jgi:hypothetical protein
VSRAYPYRRPPGDVVTGGPWLRVGGDSLVELPPELPEWDYGTVLHLRRPMRVDGLRARETCGLAPESAVTLTVVWAAANSALRGAAWQGELPAVDGAELEIDFELAGDELGGRLDLETSLVLRAAAPGSSASAPNRPGSVLWREVHSVMLQGDAVLFPLAIVDFEQVRYPSGAAWHLELSEDLDSQALGSILLLANKRRPIVTSALENAATPSDADRLVLSTVQSEVIRSLVERAVVNEDFDPDNDYATGTVGALLASVLRATFPDRDLDALRREREHDPILFTTRLQHATGLMAAG